MKRAVLISLIVIAMVLGGIGAVGCRKAEPPKKPIENTTTPTNPGTEPTTPESPTTPVTNEAVGYYLSGEVVQPARLPGVQEGDLEATLKALVLGIPKEAAAFNLTTSIPQGTQVNKVSASGGEVVVDLSSEFGSGGGSLSMQSRVAQIVFTATRDPKNTKVRILIDGKAVPSIGGEGVMIEGPQTRESWEPFSPPVLIESPILGDTVGNPVKVIGTANVFEARFKLELTDGDGGIVATRDVMATSGTGTRGTFEANMDYTSAKPGVGEIIASYNSPKDGKRVVVSEIAVKFP